MTWPSNSADLFADVAFPLVVGVEGGYDKNLLDRGNWTSGEIGVGKLNGTKYGISAAAFPTLDIAGLTLPIAMSIYRHSYWLRICADALPPRIAVLLFDAAVNQGAFASVCIVQTIVGVEIDGFIGPETLDAIGKADPETLFVEIEVQRLMAYFQTSTFSTFGLGWVRRVSKIAYRSVAMQIPT